MTDIDAVTMTARLSADAGASARHGSARRRKCRYLCSILKDIQYACSSTPPHDARASSHRRASLPKTHAFRRLAAIARHIPLNAVRHRTERRAPAPASARAARYDEAAICYSRYFRYCRARIHKDVRRVIASSQRKREVNWPRFSRIAISMTGRACASGRAGR